MLESTFKVGQGEWPLLSGHRWYVATNVATYHLWPESRGHSPCPNLNVLLT